MDAALLVLLASGVGFGWQPMPDGSPGYEYLVQLEPEMAATLAEGQSIPISGEVPEEIRPIRRIRIVVGRGNLPRHTLTTRMKPFAEASRPQRYGSSTSGPQTVPPVRSNPLRYPQSNPQYPQSNPQSVVDSFGRTLQQSAQQAQNSVQGAVQQGQAWAQQNGQQVRAGVQQLFGNTGGQQTASGVAGNGSILQRAQDQAGSLIQNAQSGVQQGFDPLRQSVQQAGDQLRGAAQSVGQRTQEAVDRFGRPLQRSILNTNPAQAAGQAPAFGNGSNQNSSQPITTAQDRIQRLDQPIGGQQTNNWQATSSQRNSNQQNGTLRNGTDGWTDNNRQPAATQPSYRNQQTTTTPTWAGNNTSGDSARYRYPSADDSRWTWPPVLSRTTGNGSRYNTTGNPPASDPFDIANRQTGFQQPPQPDYRQPQPPPANSGADSWSTDSWTTDGPKFPSKSQQPAPDPFVTPDQRTYAQASPATSPWPNSSGSPQEINSRMLNRPAGSQLDPPPNQPATFVANDRSITGPGRTLGASDFGWDGRDLTDSREPPSIDNRTLPTGTKGVFPLILSWVLLSGSGAGNLYLFWSYLDVRNKYRDLVRGAARKFGGRFIDLED